MTHREQLHTYTWPRLAPKHTAIIEELPIKLEWEGEEAATFRICGKHTQVGLQCCGARRWPSSGRVMQSTYVVVLGSCSQGASSRSATVATSVSPGRERMSRTIVEGAEANHASRSSSSSAIGRRSAERDECPLRWRSRVQRPAIHSVELFLVTIFLCNLEP